MTLKLWLAQDPEADKLLAENPLALLVGMVLDQQIPLEIAFRGPKVIEDRMAAADGFESIGVSQQVPMETAFAGPKKIADRMVASTPPRSPTTTPTDSRHCVRKTCDTPFSGIDGQAYPGLGADHRGPLRRRRQPGCGRPASPTVRSCCDGSRDYLVSVSRRRGSFWHC